jgi:hypothetical protein
MLLEQAFHALPEILCGSRYPGQDYESGIVMAFTMAILQELNGRNVSNPLSCIQGERLYENEGFQSGSSMPRYLRADLVLNTGSLRVASARLGDCYGWRHENWLEAKFFRVRNKRTNKARDCNKRTNKTGPTATLLADLVRLATLVPETPGEKSSKGRYLLHIYDRPPTDYISSRRNKNKNGAGGKRQWASVVHVAGTHTAEIAELDKEPPSFQATLGAMGALSLKLSLTNVVLTPLRVQRAHTTDKTVYWCVLTRIDSVECKDGERNFEVAADRNVTESACGVFKTLRAQVAIRLGEVPETEKTEPADPAVAPHEDADVEQAPGELDPGDGAPPANA